MTETLTNSEITKIAYAAFTAGDLVTLTDLIHPDCVWIVGGNNRLTGTYHGRAATFDYFGKLIDATDGTFSLTVLTIDEIDPGTMIVTCHVSATGHEGDAYDEEMIQQLHLRNGQAVACRTFVENGHLWDRLVGGTVTITLPGQDRKAATTV